MNKLTLDEIGPKLQRALDKEVNNQEGFIEYAKLAGARHKAGNLSTRYEDLWRSSEMLIIAGAGMGALQGKALLAQVGDALLKKYPREVSAIVLVLTQWWNLMNEMTTE